MHGGAKPAHCLAKSRRRDGANGLGPHNRESAVHGIVGALVEPAHRAILVWRFKSPRYSSRSERHLNRSHTRFNKLLASFDFEVPDASCGNGTLTADDRNARERVLSRNARTRGMVSLCRPQER